MQARTQAHIQIKAAAYAALAQGYSVADVVRILEEVRDEVKGEEWKGPGSR